VGAGNSEERALLLESEESHGSARPELCARIAELQGARRWIAHEPAIQRRHSGSYPKRGGD